MEKKRSVSGFAIIDTDTEVQLAVLPLTLPIGSTVEGFERAGYSVKWTWTYER